MGIEYVWVDWVFNDGAWAGAVRDQVDAHGVEFVAELMGVTVAGVKTWSKMKGAAYADYPYPNMTNFIKFCNNFNYNPADFFMLER